MLIGEFNPVIVIGQTNCEACNETKQRLEINKTPYLYLELDELPSLTTKAIAACRRKNGVKKITVPLVIKDGQLYMGFNE